MIEDSPGTSLTSEQLRTTLKGACRKMANYCVRTKKLWRIHYRLHFLATLLKVFFLLLRSKWLLQLNIANFIAKEIIYILNCHPNLVRMVKTQSLANVPLMYRKYVHFQWPRGGVRSLQQQFLGLLTFLLVKLLLNHELFLNRLYFPYHTK